MKFSLDYVIEYIVNEEIDFIATVTSNWHAVGVDAFLHDLSKKNDRKLRGVIIVNYHVKSGLYVNESDFISSNFFDIKFFYLKNPKFHFKGSLEGFKNLLISKNKDKKPIYIISVIEPSFSSFGYFKDKLSSKKYDPKYVLIDEGFGTYVSKKVLKSAMDHDYNFRYNFQSILRIYFIRTFLSALKIFIFNLFQVERRFIFKKKLNKLNPNYDIIKSYKSILNIRNKNLEYKWDIETENFLVLATAPLSEYDIISLDMEIDIINVISTISRKKGITTVIKPHPRELNDKYSSICNIHGVKIINNDFPLEDWLAGLNPICIIGYGSTALVNAKIFYGIDSLNISDIAYKKSENKKFIQMSDFKSLTEDFILSVDNLDEIDAYLKKKMYN